MKIDSQSEVRSWKETSLRTRKSCSGICNYRMLCSSSSNRSSGNSRGTYMVVVAVVSTDNCSTGTNGSSKRSSDRVALI